LNFNSTKEQLEDFFSTCGEVKTVRVGMDEDGRSKGFAFIEFSSQEEAERAVNLDGEEFSRRTLKVRKTTDQPT
jgi:RNA recognition motif-containing protein